MIKTYIYRYVVILGMLNFEWAIYVSNKSALISFHTIAVKKNR